MGLLAPAFLAGLVALAVPLLIHLIRRERPDAVEFPSLMFLSRIPQPVAKRRRIRNWWLFALRCLALILLVGAFARPFVDRSGAGLAAGDVAGEVVILLDRSYSMGYGDRWQRAVTAAREAVEALGPNDRATLIVFDAVARVVTPATSDVARLRAALDTLRVGAGITRYTPPLQLAQNVLSASDLPRREAVLISDMQRSGWDGADGARLPAGATLRTVAIGGEEFANVMIPAVTLARARVAGRERVTPTVHVHNAGASQVRVPVTLDVEGRTLQSIQLDVPAHGATSVELQPLTLDGSALRVTVSAGTDALPVDNVHRFVLEPDPGVRVLAVEPTGRDGGLYVRRALELAADPPVVLTVKRGALPTDAELERADVVLLNDVLPPDGDAGRRLAEWVRAGGGLVVALGDRSANAQWSGVARGLAGGTPDRVVDRVSDGGARLGYLDYSHPVLEVFRAPRAGGFGAARFYRYRPLPVADVRAAEDTASGGVRVLARFDDGAAALVERPLDRGRVLLWGTTLDTNWSNLPLEPVWLPLLHQVVRRAAGFEPRRPATTAGRIVDVGTGDDVPLIVNAPGGRRIDVPAENTLVVLEEQGFYEVREARAGAGTLRHYAVNVDVAESDPGTIDAGELVAALTVPGADPRAAAAAVLSREDQEKRQALWWYLLVVVLALLTAETVLANRRSARVATR